MNVVKAAQKYTGRDVSVCAINAASGYQAGGGFTSGGRHALEEALCTQSTLYSSLEAVLQNSSNMGREKVPYFPANSAILSPGVTVFREGSKSGYIFMQQPYELNIVSIFMPNKNPNVRDSPVDAPQDLRAYQQLVATKMRAMLHAAALSECEVLVIPDIGCGVFQNDPAEVGRILGQELVAYAGYFDNIVLTGKAAFMDSVTTVLKQASGKNGMATYESDSEEESDNESARRSPLLCEMACQQASDSETYSAEELESGTPISAVDPHV